MTSDLTTLFQPGDDPASIAIRQGVVESWDPDTAANTIRVAGGQLLNVPVLVGETVALAEGDVVALLTTGDRWFLLGKVTDPGDPGTVPTWTADITALTGQVDTIQTVTIPAVQNDVVIVQGDVVELNTVTVPAVQAVADAAQSTADTAQAAVDPLVPLADLAAVTNGTTITGALLRSATDTAGRVEVGEDPLQPAATDTEVRIFTADPDETDPARFSGIAVTPGNFLAQVKGFDRPLAPGPKLLLRTDSTEAAAEIEADRFSVFAPADFSGAVAVAGALTKAGVPVVTTTGAQTLTDKDLSAATNVFPATLTPRTVYKTADTTINNSSALATDPHLQIAGIAAGTYTLDALILYSSSGSVGANWKGFFTATGSITDRLLQVLREPLTGNEYGVTEGASTFTAAGQGVGAKRSMRIFGSFVATAGGQAFNLQWAQNTAEVSNTVVYKGSYYRIQKIA